MEGICVRGILIIVAFKYNLEILERLGIEPPLVGGSRSGNLPVKKISVMVFGAHLKTWEFRVYAMRNFRELRFYLENVFGGDQSKHGSTLFDGNLQ